jgi:RNA polymerase sigma-70 factor (ECF subfamily)
MNKAPESGRPGKPLLNMSAEAFEAFYEKTARPLKSYLVRVLRNPSVADELLQESYFKFLRAQIAEMGEGERRNYLFRIATNLVHDLYRRRGEQTLPLREGASASAQEETHGRDTGLKRDVGKALASMKPRERVLVWLAYVEGSSHREIAEILGLREISIRPMLFRAKQKLAGLLRIGGYGARVLF